MRSQGNGCMEVVRRWLRHVLLLPRRVLRGHERGRIHAPHIRPHNGVGPRVGTRESRDAIPLRLWHGHWRQGDVGTREGPHGERSPRALSCGDHDPPRRFAANARRALEGAWRRRATHPPVASLARPPMALAQRRHHDRGTRPRHDSRRAQRRIQARAGQRRSGGLGAERRRRREGSVRTQA